MPPKTNSHLNSKLDRIELVTETVTTLDGEEVSLQVVLQAVYDALFALPEPPHFTTTEIAPVISALPEQLNIAPDVLGNILNAVLFEEPDNSNISRLPKYIQMAGRDDVLDSLHVILSTFE